ncbi:MAG: hypothetical protein J6C67_03420 [Muribaculaceae bacterium]|nr:hypothetical protein [Muribaculaceae bacterium]
MGTENVVDRNSPVFHVLFAMWRNWAVCFGAVALLLGFALFTAKTWLPFIALGEVYILASLIRGAFSQGMTGCALLPRVAQRTLLVAAIIMLAINLLCTDWMITARVRLELYNSEIPFITSLVVLPVLAFFCGLSLLRGADDPHCRRCQEEKGFYAGDSVLGTLFYREARYQLTILLLMSVLMAALEYWYYFSKYINTNFNAPDRFFFIFMPIGVYVVSLVVMAGRYASMARLYMALDEAKPERVNTSRVRFMVFSGDELLVRRGDNGLWDTPVETIVPMRTAMGPKEARLMFTELTGAENFGLRYCFTNATLASGANTIHYAVFIPDNERESMESEGDRWFNAYFIDFAMAEGIMAPALATELYRIHTITMAWKTYDRKGNRLYPIKHYHPTFRLSDLPDWNVDYDDMSWLAVARNNEDRRFFRLRRFWNKITGVFIRNDRQQ